MKANRIYAHSCEDMRELDDGSVALTVTSPPYWNAIDYDIHASDKQRHYRTRKYAQGYADYEDYLAWLDRIFGEVLRVTSPGGYCAIVIGTVLLNGRHTLAYGLGNWYLVNGDRSRARAAFERALHAEGGWPSFGFILAETETGGRKQVTGNR